MALCWYSQSGSNVLRVTDLTTSAPAISIDRQVAVATVSYTVRSFTGVEGAAWGLADGLRYEAEARFDITDTAERIGSFR